MPELTRTARAEFDRFAGRHLRRSRTPGLVVLAHRHGKPALERSFGHRDRELGIPTSPETLYGIASVTKSFTCVALLQLQESGKLSVNDRVIRHLPEFRTREPAWSRRIRIHHLMTHTSGLPPLPSIYYEMSRSLRVDDSFDARAHRRVGIDIDRPPIESYVDLLQYLARGRYRSLGPPGAQFSYSNEAFGLLGAIIESVSGETYERYLEDHLLRPAALNSTVFDSGVMFRLPSVTNLYTRVARRGRSRVEAAPVWHEMSALRAAGALRTNARDLLRYLELYRTGGRIGGHRLLSASSARAMMTPRFEFLPGVSYGYGLITVPQFRGATLVGHGGGLKGVASCIALVPERGITAVGLSNFDGCPTGTIVLGAINLMLRYPAATPMIRRPRRARPFGPLDRYVGLYGSGEGWWLRVAKRRTHLVIDLIGIELTGKALRATPSGPDSFVVGPRGSEELIQFRRSPDGRVDAVELGLRIVRRRSETERRALRNGSGIW